MLYKGTKFFEANKSFPFTFPSDPTIYMKTKTLWNTQGSTGNSPTKQNRKSAPLFVFEDNGRAEMCQFPNVSF